MRSLALAIIGFVAPMWATMAPSLGAQELQITVISCPRDTALEPVALIDSQEFGDDFALRPSQVLEAASPGVYAITASIGSGHMRIRVQSAHCSGTFFITVLPGESRHVTLPTREPDISLYSFGQSLAGELPAPVLAAWLVAPNGSLRIVTIDGSAYYLEHVPPLQYVLRLELANFQADIPLDLRGAQGFSVSRHDITMSELRRHLGGILKNGETWLQCSWCLP